MKQSEIYANVETIRARKRDGSLWQHAFRPGARAIARRDGSVVIRGPRPLHDLFDHKGKPERFFINPPRGKRTPPAEYRARDAQARMRYEDAESGRRWRAKGAKGVRQPMLPRRTARKRLYHYRAKRNIPLQIINPPQGAKQMAMPKALAAYWRKHRKGGVAGRRRGARKSTRARHNYWTNNRVGHRLAALKGWARKKSGSSFRRRRASHNPPMVRGIVSSMKEGAIDGLGVLAGIVAPGLVSRQPFLAKITTNPWGKAAVELATGAVISAGAGAMKQPRFGRNVMSGTFARLGLKALEKVAPKVGVGIADIGDHPEFAMQEVIEALPDDASASSSVGEVIPQDSGVGDDGGSSGDEFGFGEVMPPM